jgi:hypothetical protein
LAFLVFFIHSELRGLEKIKVPIQGMKHYNKIRISFSFTGTLFLSRPLNPQNLKITPGIYVWMALIWLVPDRQIERVLF